MRLDSIPPMRAIIEPIAESRRPLVVALRTAALRGKTAFNKVTCAKIGLDQEVSEVVAVVLRQRGCKVHFPRLKVEAESFSDVARNSYRTVSTGCECTVKFGIARVQGNIRLPDVAHGCAEHGIPGTILVR